MKYELPKFFILKMEKPKLREFRLKASKSLGLYQSQDRTQDLVPESALHKNSIILLLMCVYYYLVKQWLGTHVLANIKI